MTKFILSFHIILFYFQYSYSIDKKNAVNWNNTGSSSNLPSNASIIDLKDFGLKSDNSTDNS